MKLLVIFTKDAPMRGFGLPLVMRADMTLGMYCFEVKNSGGMLELFPEGNFHSQHVSPRYVAAMLKIEDAPGFLPEDEAI